MIKIESYLKFPQKQINDLNDVIKNPKNYFIGINDLDNLQKLKKHLDSFYIKGVIVFLYNKEIIFDYTYWDLIDQLWIYFINLIEELEQNGISKTYFPSQSIKICLKKLRNNMISFSLISDEEKHWIIPKDEFYNAIFTHARDFFKKLMFIFPENIQDYKEELKRIDEVEQMTLQSKN